MTQAVHLADNCDAAKEKYCYMPTSKRKFREEWIAEHTLYLDETGRVYTDVLLHGEPAIMDAMTGSLYRDGKCLSSSRLHLRILTENREEATEVLRKMVRLK
jgi:hypothetical protein